MNKVLLKIIGLLAFLSATYSSAEDWSLDTRGFALSGYDPVAYFTQNDAVEGNLSWVYQWKGANWQFSSETNKNLFIATPQKFIPEFGGYCANGLSDGHKVPADPENWRIIDGKLYVFFSKWGQLQWALNVEEQINLATETWIKLRTL